jgi:biotin carboxyl carrier protein
VTLRRYSVAIDDRTFTIDVRETAADRFEVAVDGRRFEATLLGDRDLPGGPISPEMAVGAAHPRMPEAAAPRVAPGTSHPRPASPAGTSACGATLLTAPLPGVVLDVLVGAGDAVHRGDPILVLEAMKMRNTIRAPVDGVVVEIPVEAGQPVGAGEVLVRFEDGPP